MDEVLNTVGSCNKETDLNRKLQAEFFGKAPSNKKLVSLIFFMVSHR